MLNVPKKISERFHQRLKSLQSIIQGCKDRDVNESNTVTLVLDILCDLLGYDKYSEITKEHQIRSTYCDLAIQKNGVVQYLIEVKAIGYELKDNHTQQALNYAANKGCEWVFLTNGSRWIVYKVIFGQPIAQEIVIDIDLLCASSKNQADIEALYAMSKEGSEKNALNEYYIDRQAKDRFCIAAVLQTEPILLAVRKELRTLSPGIKIETDEILSVLFDQVIKRELLEGEKAAEAKKRIRKIQKKKDTKTKASTNTSTSESSPPTTDVSSEDVSTC
jgi:hypothetical protein